MTWQEVCDDRSLRNLPYKVELDGWGRIVMSPHRKEHSVYQGEIGARLSRLLPGGKVMSECAIDTAAGVKVADVAWASRERWNSMTGAPSCSVAPEICVEATSMSNDGGPDLEQARAFLDGWMATAATRTSRTTRSRRVRS